ncbi:IclR family transcriptional regulator [Novosphingobium humi]
MLEAILSDRDGRSVAAIATAIGLPVATAHRQVATLVAEDFLARLPARQFGPGKRLMRLIQMFDEKQVIATAAASTLHRLAADLDCVVQLGTLESDMVTYRIKTGAKAGDLFTRVGLQLEAYCSGIGKVLLAHLPEAQREAYLATGPFPALTAHTITSPAKLRQELVQVMRDGLARDMEETAEGLSCVAVPVAMPDGRVLVAISASRTTRNIQAFSANDLGRLRDAAKNIEAAVALAKGMTV